MIWSRTLSSPRDLTVSASTHGPGVLGYEGCPRGSWQRAHRCTNSCLPSLRPRRATALLPPPACRTLCVRPSVSIPESPATDSGPPAPYRGRGATRAGRRTEVRASVTSLFLPLLRDSERHPRAPLEAFHRWYILKAYWDRLQAKGSGLLLIRLFQQICSAGVCRGRLSLESPRVSVPVRNRKGLPTVSGGEWATSALRCRFASVAERGDWGFSLRAVYSGRHTRARQIGNWALGTRNGHRAPRTRNEEPRTMPIDVAAISLGALLIAIVVAAPRESTSGSWRSPWPG